MGRGYFKSRIKSRQFGGMVKMISKITDQIYIGDQVDATNKELLEQLNFNCILNLNDREDLDEEKISKQLGINYIVYKIPEKKQFKIRLHEASEILKNLEDTKYDKILVHCEAGIDRAPFVVALYLSKKLNVPIHKAYNIVKYFRPQTFVHTEWI